MNELVSIFGETPEFWDELRTRVRNKQFTESNLLREIVELSAKVQYYELKLDQINNFRQSLKEKI